MINSSHVFFHVLVLYVESKDQLALLALHVVKQVNMRVTSDTFRKQEHSFIVVTRQHIQKRNLPILSNECLTKFQWSTSLCRKLNVCVFTYGWRAVCKTRIQ